MEVNDYLLENIEEETLHMGLIDPAEQKPEETIKIVRTLEDCGSDAVMIGGSTGIVKEELDKTVLSIKEETDLPTILFPSTANSISQYADAIYFMSMLNSKKLERVIGEQVAGAPLIKKTGIEPISMGYLVVEPGMTVGKVGEANLISRNDNQQAINYGLAAKYLGMDFLYLEAGSGAPDPIPGQMVHAVKKNVELPLIVGGGIKEKEQAESLAKKGADILVTGTIIEETRSLEDKIKNIISAIK